MKFNWIFKPNRWYDNQKEPFRMLFFLSLAIGLLLIGDYLLFRPLGLIFVSILGIYRSSYFIIFAKDGLGVKQ